LEFIMLRRFAVVVVVLLAAPAFAESRWGLTWRASESCIGPGELAQAVEAQLKRPLFAKDPQVRVEGSLQAGTAPRWRARFSLVTAAGEVLGTREIDADETDCRALDKRLVLAMALAIEPELNRAPSPERAPVHDAPVLPPGSVQVHLDSDNREARLLRLAGTSYGTGVSGG
jgi:hypothetical protein